MTKEEMTPWYIFAWSVSIFTAVVGFLFWRIEVVHTNQEDSGNDIAEIRVDLAIVKTDSAWIRRVLEKEGAVARN